MTKQMTKVMARLKSQAEKCRVKSEKSGFYSMPKSTLEQVNIFFITTILRLAMKLYFLESGLTMTLLKFIILLMLVNF